MDAETIGAMVSAGVGAVFTIFIVVLLIKGVRSLQGIRDLLGRTPGDRQ